MPDANEIQSALSEALEVDDAGSQSAKESSPEVAEALQEVLKTGENAESPSDDETGKSAKDDGKEPKTVPYERLSKVVQQKNEIADKYNNLEAQLKTATASNEDLRTKLGTQEQDSQILEAIKNLAQDDKYRDHVVAIDKALQGIDDEVVEAEERGDDKAQSAALKKFETKAAELDEILAKQRADGLWNEADTRAKEMLASLPEGYTEQDRATISQLWNSHVDWNGIEDKGSESIPEALNSSFVKVIKEYGTPRGALVANTTKEIESRIPEAKVTSGEDAVKDLLKRDWAETDDDGKAKYSDAEFNEGMADLLRKAQVS